MSAYGALEKEVIVDKKNQKNTEKRGNSRAGTNAANPEQTGSVGGKSSVLRKSSLTHS